MNKPQLKIGVISWRATAVAVSLLFFAGDVFAQDAMVAKSQQVIERIVAIPPQSDTQLARVQFDSQLYNRSADDFRDLRLLDRSRKEVSYLIKQRTTAETKTARKTWNVFDATLKPSTAEGLEIRFKLKKDDPQPDGISLVTPLVNFEQVVKVFAVSGGTETSLVDNAILFDYSQYMNVRRTEIPLPKNRAQEFRLVIQSPTIEQQSTFSELTRQLQGGVQNGLSERSLVVRQPFRIDRIELWHEVEETAKVQPVIVEYPVKVGKQENDLEKGQTRITFVTNREPLARIELVATDKNFSRFVEVWRKGPDGEFNQVVGRGTVKRIAFASIHEEDLKVPVEETRQGIEYQVIIENRDSPPLNVTTIQAFGRVDELVFLAETDEEYRLQYAGEGMTKPNYDTAAISVILEKRTEPVLAMLGDAQERVVDAKVTKWTLNDFLSDPWVFGPVIILLVIILAAVLFQAAKKIDGISGDVEGN